MQNCLAEAAGVEVFDTNQNPNPKELRKEHNNLSGAAYSF